MDYFSEERIVPAISVIDNKQFISKPVCGSRYFQSSRLDSSLRREEKKHKLLQRINLGLKPREEKPQRRDTKSTSSTTLVSSTN